MFTETVTVFATEEGAEVVAAANRADDSEWTYTVKPYGKGYAVVIADEDGAEIGYL